MNRDQLVYGITGTRGVGKDTLFACLAAIDPHTARYAFADAVRADLAPFFVQHYGIDIWHCTPEEKEVCRPLLIGHGMGKRAQDPLYWVKKTAATIKKDLALGLPLSVCVTDARFVNEAEYMRAAFPGFRLINLVREGAPPPTDEEEKHYRKVAAMADYAIYWGDNTAEERQLYARKLIAWLKDPTTVGPYMGIVARS